VPGNAKITNRYAGKTMHPDRVKIIQIRFYHLKKLDRKTGVKETVHLLVGRGGK